VSTNGKTAAAIAIAAFFLMANAASAEHRAGGRAGLRHLPHAFEHAYGYVPRQPPGQGTRYDSRADAFSSDSLGRQSFPNPDRDFSIENLRSHPSD
jgi:hypothetical protein